MALATASQAGLRRPLVRVGQYPVDDQGLYEEDTGARSRFDALSISDISGATGQAIIRAILNGKRDPWKLAKLRDRRIKATEEEIARSLEGNWRADMLFELKQAVDAYDFIQNQIAECDQRLQTLLAALPQREVKKAEVQAEAPLRESVKRKQKRRNPVPMGTR